MLSHNVHLEFSFIDTSRVIGTFSQTYLDIYLAIIFAMKRHIATFYFTYFVMLFCISFTVLKNSIDLC